MRRLRLPTILIAVYLILPPVWMLGEEVVDAVATAKTNSRVVAALERIEAGMTRPELQAVLHEEGVDERRVRWKNARIELVTSRSVSQRATAISISESFQVVDMRHGQVVFNGRGATELALQISGIVYGGNHNYWPYRLGRLYGIVTLPMALLGVLCAIRDRKPRRRYQRHRTAGVEGG